MHAGVSPGHWNGKGEVGLVVWGCGFELGPSEVPSRGGSTWYEPPHSCPVWKVTCFLRGPRGDKFTCWGLGQGSVGIRGMWALRASGKPWSGSYVGKGPLLPIGVLPGGTGSHPGLLLQTFRELTSFLCLVCPRVFVCQVWACTGCTPALSPVDGPRGHL